MKNKPFADYAKQLKNRKLCRNGLHPKGYIGRCSYCLTATQKRYHDRKKEKERDHIDTRTQNTPTA